MGYSPFINTHAQQGCKVAKCRWYLGEVGVGFLRTLRVGFGYFYPTWTLEGELTKVSHRTHKLRVLTRDY